mgnify:CR=1 FL=1
MTEHEKKYYDNYFDLFASDGWKQFIEDITEIYHSYNVDHCNSADDLFKAKGERAVLSRILGFSNGIEAAYASIENGNFEADE